MRKYPQNAVSSKLYGIWNGMKNRCYTRNSGSYKNYGAKGVRICDEWHYDYMKFYKWRLRRRSSLTDKGLYASYYIIDKGYKREIIIIKYKRTILFEPFLY